jgi:signal transduction histidine kinase
MKIPSYLQNSVHLPPSAKRDALLLPALFLLNCFFFSAWLQLGDVSTKPWLLLVWLYGLIVLVPLIWRDAAPLTVFVIQWVLTVAAWPIMPRFTPVVGVPVALYAVSVQRGRKVSLLALLASFIPNGLDAAVAFRVFSSPADRLQSFVPNVILLVIVTVGVWGMGQVTHAGQRHVRQLERERETVREAVAEERRRIARELHDIVSHAVTVIVLQAAGARRIADTDFAQVTQSLKHIETTGKQAMAELRRLLGVLKASDPDTTHSPGISDLGPQPGLMEVPALLSALQDTGMKVSFHTEGEPRSLDPSVDLAAYRILQEGLTNVLKHAGKDPSPQLRLVWETHSVLIEIDNDTDLAEERRGQGLSLGVGLVGLRERAHAAGGCLHAGRHHGGGHRLTAILPIVDSAQQMILEQSRKSAPTSFYSKTS